MHGNFGSARIVGFSWEVKMKPHDIARDFIFFAVCVSFVSFVFQKFKVKLNLAKRGLSTVVGLSQLAPFEATSYT